MKKINISDLLKPIPYKWKVQSFTKSANPKGICVAYIDARNAMKVLDNVCGPENWQDDYKEVNGVVYGGVGIRIGGKSDDFDNWIWKWDAGAESNMEKEKGQASDSFKRACVKWGLGRFLYELEIKIIPAFEQGGKRYPGPSSAERIWDVNDYIKKNLKDDVADGIEQRKKEAAEKFKADKKMWVKRIQATKTMKDFEDVMAIIPDDIEKAGKKWFQDYGDKLFAKEDNHKD